MKTRVFKLFLPMLLAFTTVNMQAETTELVSWTFNTGYDVTENTYVPNTSDPTGTSATAVWFSAGLPIIRPNTFIGNQGDYYVSAKTTRYWYLKQHWYNSESNQGPYMFQIATDDGNTLSNISDYTDPAQHTNYYEISFPTKNYKNIHIGYKLASSGGTADDLTVAYSSDGGTTWSVAGSTTTNTAWYVYTADSKELIGTANKDNVLVRIFAANGVNGHWFIDDITVTGEYATVFTPEYTLTTSVQPTGAGSVARDLNASTYEENTSVALTASANTGYAFVEWQDGAGNQLSTSSTYNVTITENTSVVAVYEIAPIAANTEITAAQWTFDTGYDAAGLVYTPNDNDFAEIATTQSKNGNVPQILANTSYSAQSKNIASVSNDDTGKTYYKVFDNANNGTSYGKVFCLYPNGISNNITDVTDASQHTVFYEFTFPTTGLKDVGITYDITHAKNKEYTISVAYSTDNGTTWTEATAGVTKDAWWQFQTNSTTISADNKEKVIVRLLPQNEADERFYLDQLTVTGKIASDDVTVSASKYATYYNSIPVQLPAGLEAATIDGEADGQLTLNYRYGEGDVIPSGTAVLLKAEAAGTYQLTYVANDATAAPSGNMLMGSDEAVTTSGGAAGAKYYALQYGSTAENADKLGFYWMATDGGAFTSAAHKAWLTVPAGAGARSFIALFESGDATLIDTIRTQEQTGKTYFNLGGQRTATPKKGIYIEGGKKVVVK